MNTAPIMRIMQGQRAVLVPATHGPGRWLRAALGIGVCAGLALTAHATALYRCHGDEGETVFTSRAGHDSACHPITRTTASASHRSHAGFRLKKFGALAAAKAKPASMAQTMVSSSDVVSRPAPASAPLSRAKAPTGGAAVLPLAKPWPLAVLETTAANLTSLLQPRSAMERNKDTPPVRVATHPEASVAVANATTPRVQPLVPPDKVYRVLHADGTMEYTNARRPLRVGEARLRFTYLATCFACNLRSRIDWSRVPLHLQAYDGEIRMAAAQTGIDEALLRAVIHAESGFNPRALSARNAQGLMQLMPGTAGELGVGNAFDIRQNIRGGARYLAGLLRDFGGNIALTAAAYNAGEAAVRKYNGVPPYAETRVYVYRVALLRNRYALALRSGRVMTSIVAP